MQPVTRLGALVGLLLCAGTAHADEWRGYMSLGAGMALDHMSEWNAKGAAVNMYFGIEAPLGLSVGVYGEAAETWGEKFDDLQNADSNRVQLDYQQYGLEVRMRVLRERMISPWLALRLARSKSTPQTPDEFGQLVRQEFSAVGGAVRFGFDLWLGDHVGATAATSWQWCDVRYEEDAARHCAKPISTILVGPTVRF